MLTSCASARISPRPLTSTGREERSRSAGLLSTGLNDYIAAGNFYYKIIDAYTWWLEPTAGFRFTQSSYDASAAALGLASGHAWRVQGGMRLAGNYFWGGVLVTPSITGLAYDDVDVTGLVVTGGQFNASPIIPLDQGKVRGQGILAQLRLWHRRLGVCVREVHGGNLFGAGGKRAYVTSGDDLRPTLIAG